MLVGFFFTVYFILAFLIFLTHPHPYTLTEKAIICNRARHPLRICYTTNRAERKECEFCLEPPKN